MTSGNINRSLGLSALVIMSIAGLALTGSVAARADIIPGSQAPYSTSVLGNGDTLYTYDAYVTGPQPTTANNGEKVEYGDYFTIYDFTGFVDNTYATPAGWVMSYSFVSPDMITGTQNVSVPDSALIPNVTFTYKPTDPTSTITGGQDLGLFQIESVNSYTAPTPTTAPTQYLFGGEANRVDNGNLQSNQSDVYGPDGAPTGHGTPVLPTPEPGVFVTAASMLSMTGLGLVRGRRRAKAVKTAA